MNSHPATPASFGPALAALVPRLRRFGRLLTGHPHDADDLVQLALERGAGTVTAVSGALITVSLTDANFLPSSNSVVVDTATARFTHGQASDVTVGASVRFAGKAATTGTTKITASVFDLDGAPSNPGGGDKYNPGVSGKVAAVASTTSFTLTVTTATATVPAGTYTVNASQAEFESGTASCLVVGAQVKVRGTLSGATLTATRIDIAGCSGQKHASPGRG